MRWDKTASVSELELRKVGMCEGGRAAGSRSQKQPTISQSGLKGGNRGLAVWIRRNRIIRGGPVDLGGDARNKFRKCIGPIAFSLVRLEGRQPIDRLQIIRDTHVAHVPRDDWTQWWQWRQRTRKSKRCGRRRPQIAHRKVPREGYYLVVILSLLDPFFLQQVSTSSKPTPDQF